MTEEEEERYEAKKRNELIKKELKDKSDQADLREKDMLKAVDDIDPEAFAWWDPSVAGNKTSSHRSSAFAQQSDSDDSDVVELESEFEDNDDGDDDDDENVATDEGAAGKRSKSQDPSKKEKDKKKRERDKDREKPHHCPPTPPSGSRSWRRSGTRWRRCCGTRRPRTSSCAPR